MLFMLTCRTLCLPAVSSSWSSRPLAALEGCLVAKVSNTLLSLFRKCRLTKPDSVAQLSLKRLASRTTSQAGKLLTSLVVEQRSLFNIVNIAPGSWMMQCCSRWNSNSLRGCRNDYLVPITRTSLMTLSSPSCISPCTLSAPWKGPLDAVMQQLHTIGVPPE